MCVLIYTLLVPPTGINTEHSFDINYFIVDVLVVHTQTLYYTPNILLLLTKQKCLKPMHDIDNMVMTMTKMVIYINWLMELYNDIRMLVMTLMVLLYV